MVSTQQVNGIAEGGHKGKNVSKIKQKKTQLFIMCFHHGQFDLVDFGNFLSRTIFTDGP